VNNYGARYPIGQGLQQISSYQIKAALQESGWSLPCQVQSVSDDGLFVTVSIAVNNLSELFANITIPIMESQYVRLPIQKGDVGVARKADVSLYPISGQRDGSPNFGQDGNYEALLAFEPISTKGSKNGISGFPASSDINSTWIYGPDGVVLQDLKVDENGHQLVNGKITISSSGVTVQDITTSGATQTVNMIATIANNQIQLKDKDGNCVATINKTSSGGITLAVGNNNITVNASQASLTFGSSNVTVNGSGVSITGTLTINGQPYTAHTHLAGTLVSPSGPVTGTTGGKV